jgi:hypothetical protein
MPEPRYFSMPSIDLLAVGPVVHPLPRSGDPLAGGDRRRVADDGHQLPMPAGLGPQNAEAVLRVMEGDPLNEAGQYFLGR